MNPSVLNLASHLFGKACLNGNRFLFVQVHTYVRYKAKKLIAKHGSNYSPNKTLVLMTFMQHQTKFYQYLQLLKKNSDIKLIETE